jgi:geranylgeranyl diphosphate synthase type I
LARVGVAELSDDEVAAIQQVLLDTGALDELETQIETLTDDAVATLDDMPVTDEARKELAELAQFVAWRKR